MTCPAAWEELMAYIMPVIIADNFCLDRDDHVDDGVPITAAEWDLL